MSFKGTSCPCTSGQLFDVCCEPVLADLKKAINPEQVMRARYSAFVTGDIKFLKESTHSDQRSSFNEKEIADWSSHASWEGLSLINCEQLDANQGTVEFVARYSLEKKTINHHEIATFTKEKGAWYFVDGKIISDSIKRDAPKIGRNDPCICGSGKKYKKCCLE